MGYDADAILVYGVDLGEDLYGLPFYDENNGVDFEKWLYRLNGVDSDSQWEGYEEWAKEHPELRGHDERMKAWKAERPGWEEALQALYKLQREVREVCPLDTTFYGSSDYPSWILHVRDMEFRQDFGGVMEVTYDMFEAEVGKLAEAFAFADAHSLPWDNPTWLLTARLGY